MTFKQILVATDFSDFAQAALDLAVEIALKFESQLTLLHAWEVPYYSYSSPLYIEADWAIPVEAAANARLATALLELQKRVPHAKAVLRAGVAWEEIIAGSKATGADLIVVGTHGRRGLSRALIGSVAEKVLRTAHLPVLTVHGAAAQQ